MIAAFEITGGYYLVVAALLFTIGAVGLLARRNVLVMFMCVELMLNAVNLTFVTFAKMLDDVGGQVIVFFTLAVAGGRGRGRAGDHRGDLPSSPRCHRRRPHGAQGLTMARDLLDLVWIVPLLPLLGAATLLVLGKRIGEPRAGWLASGLMAGSFVWSVVTFFALHDLPESARAHVTTIFTWLPSGGLHVEHGLPRRSAVGHVHPLRHRRRHADPRLRDRLHARRPALLPLLRLHEPVLRLDADPGARLELPRHLPRVGGRRAVLVPAHLVLVRAPRRGDRRQEGVHHHPHRRLRLHDRDVPDLLEGRHARLLGARRGEQARPEAPRPRSRSCSSSARSARARSSRCTSGCPTPWRARPRSRRSSTPRRW